MLPEFALERYLARWEFSAPHLLCTSDIEGYKLAELLSLSDDDARERWQHLSLGYTEPSGHPALRREIASLYQGVSPEEVLTFAGAEEAIFVVSHALLGPGTHAVVLTPAYQALHEVPRAAGAEVTLVALDERQGWRLDLEAVRKALRPNTRLIVANFPNSPTGALPSAEAFRDLVALAREAGAHLLSDEVYRWLEYDAGERLPAAVECDERGVSLGAMSKAFGLAGLRIGWMVTRDRALIHRATQLKDYASICNSGPSEALAIMALRARDSVLARSRALMTNNLRLFDELFAAYAEVFAWTRPRAGSVGFPRLRRAESADDFTEAVRAQEGVLLLPGRLFGSEWRAHFRVGFGRTTTPDALARFARFVRSYA